MYVDPETVGTVIYQLKGITKNNFYIHLYFGDRISPCGPGQPGTVDQADFESACLYLSGPATVPGKNKIDFDEAISERARLWQQT